MALKDAGALVTGGSEGIGYAIAEALVAKGAQVAIMGRNKRKLEAARHFIDQERGHIVNVGSTSGLSGGRSSTAYSGSKFALRGMSECWRAELRPYNIRVTLVNPSEVQTTFFAKLGRNQELSEKKLRPQEIADAVVGALEIDERGFIPEFAVFATNPW